MVGTNVLVQVLRRSPPLRRSQAGRPSRGRTEPLLSVLCGSVDRTIEQAHRSVRDYYIKVFE